MSDILLQQKTDDGILILTLNRPDAMNCFNFDLLSVLADVIREANFDMGLRCIVITGSKAGDDPKKWSFSTGADLKERRSLTPGPGPPLHLHDPEHLHGRRERPHPRHRRDQRLRLRRRHGAGAGL